MKISENANRSSVLKLNRGSMKRFINYNFGLDEVSANSPTGDTSGQGDDDSSKDLFDMVCNQRFSGIDDDVDEEIGAAAEGKAKENNACDDDEQDEDEDPWATRTKQIEFSSNVSETTDPTQNETGKGSKSSSDFDEDVKPDAKMEVDVVQDTDRKYRIP